MKIIVKIPSHLQIVDIEEEFPNRILSYELIQDLLIVHTTDMSNVSPELFKLKLKLKSGEHISEYVFAKSYTSFKTGNYDIEWRVVG